MRIFLFDTALFMRRKKPNIVRSATPHAIKEHFIPIQLGFSVSGTFLAGGGNVENHHELHQEPRHGVVVMLVPTHVNISSSLIL